MDGLLVVGDILHLMALFALLLQLLAGRDARGLSYKTQELFLIAFLTRYSDMILLGSPSLLYFFVTRTLIIGCSIAIIFLMLFTFRSKAYDRQADSFPHLWVYSAAALIALLLPQHKSAQGYLWTFSIWLEAASIIPQLTLLRKDCSFPPEYASLMALYRSMYVLHWIIEWDKANMHSILGGAFQVMLLSYFIFDRETKRKEEKMMSLPL